MGLTAGRGSMKGGATRKLLDDLRLGGLVIHEGIALTEVGRIIAENHRNKYLARQDQPLNPT